MNKVLGGLVMIAGVAGLGIWGANDHAERMQTKITAAAAQVADRSVHGVVTTVNGRDIRVSGLADGPGEHDALLAALHDIEGRRVVVGDLKVLTVQQPFTFAARKAENGISLSGYVPTEKARAELGAAADSLTLAAGAPEGWTGAAATSVAALDTVIEGEISLSDAEASYAGLVRTPAERDVALEVLAGLPEGYSASGQFEMQDDGTPPAFHLLYDAQGGAEFAGKLPEGFDPAHVLGIDAVRSSAKAGLMGDPGNARDRVSGLAGWLPEFETLDAKFGPDGDTVSGLVSPGVDLDLVAQALRAELGADAKLVLDHAEAPIDGSERLNLATGRMQIAHGGFWMEKFEFAADADTCASEAAAVLQRNRINFVIGSARLDGRAMRAVSSMAGVMRLCIFDAELLAEIGGHTDSQGSDASNMELSLARAKAVKDALVARGVPYEALTAAGYGETRPIASNDTEEGRASNRRTTVVWSQSQ